jgi:thiamine biosynthesis protein ThiS
MTSIIKVVANGKPVSISEGTTLLDFCKAQSVDPAHVVAELNGLIVKKEQYGDRILKDGDSFEIVRFVGGG